MSLPASRWRNPSQEEINELIKELDDMKYDFKPFQKVLVRDSSNTYWKAAHYSHTEKGRFSCSGFCWNYCLPYEGNERLLGTTNDPKPKHEFKWGDRIMCEHGNGEEYEAIYIGFDSDKDAYVVMYKNCTVATVARKIRPYY